MERLVGAPVFGNAARMKSVRLKSLARTSSMKSGKAISTRKHKSRIAYSLSKKGRNRKNGFVNLGRLIGQNLTSSSLFNIAESFVKRIKSFLSIGWARCNMVKPAYSTACLPVPASGDGDAATVHAPSINSRDLDSTEERQNCFADINHNLNAKSSSARHNKPGKKTCKARTKCLPARPPGRPRRTHHKQAKVDKSPVPDRCVQQSKRCSTLGKRCARLKKEDVIMPMSSEIVDSLQFVETLDTNPCQHKIEESTKKCQLECSQIEFCMIESPQCDKQDFCMTEIVQCSKKSEATSAKENKSQLGKEERTRNKRRKRQNAEIKLNMGVLDRNDVLSVESKDAKQKCSRKRSTPLRKKCERANAVNASQANIASSSFNLKTALTDMNDWPSLVEIERPKGLIKEAAREIVRNKQVGSVAKNARKLMADIAALMIKDIDTNRQATTFALPYQQSDSLTPAASQKTWASVAAQSLVDASIVGLTAPSASLLNPTEDNKNRHSSGPLDMFKPQPFLDKKKPKSEKCLTGCEERIKLSNNRKSGGNRKRQKFDEKNRGKRQKFDDKDRSLVLPAPKQNNKRKPFERFYGKIGCSPLVPLSNKFSKDVTCLPGSCGADGRHGLIVQLWKKACAIRGQTASLDEDGVGKQKKISARYRALLRSENGGLDSKTATEIQARSKLTDNRLQDKASTRAKQRQDRLERQRAHHNYQFSPAPVATETSKWNRPTAPVVNRCPYWLRSQSYRSEITQLRASSYTDPSFESREDIEMCIVNILQTPQTPCRRSERLIEKNALKMCNPIAGCQ